MRKSTGFNCFKPKIAIVLWSDFLFSPSPLPLSFHNSTVGYKSKVDSSSMFGSNSKIVEEEVSRKKDQYQNNAEMMQLSKHCEMEKVIDTQ